MVCDLGVCLLCAILKELYTSETTLAQKIVLAPLNNEFRFKNSYLTSFMLKNPPEFLKKNLQKSVFSLLEGSFLFLNHVFQQIYYTTLVLNTNHMYYDNKTLNIGSYMMLKFLDFLCFFVI